MENKPYDAIIGSSSAPYETELAAACGLATNYHGVTHPSLPNYIAATSGSTQGIADNDPPSSHPLDVPSIFSQVKAAGKTWRAYEESAPGNARWTSSGQYAVKHDPASYYTGIRSDCAVWDVPMGTTAAGNFLTDLTGGTLPAFSFVTPDLCNDTHDCSVATGDAWLKSWFAKILASPTYLAGRTVVFLTWDEDDGSASNRVPTDRRQPVDPGRHQVGDVLRPLLVAEDDRAAPRDHDVPRPRRRRGHVEHGLDASTSARRVPATFPATSELAGLCAARRCRCL